MIGVGVADMMAAGGSAAISWLVQLAYGLSGLVLALALCLMAKRRSAPRGYRLAMTGMGLVIGATLCAYSAAALPHILIALVLGGGAGFFVARHMAMPALPRLVAAFHSLFGLTAMGVGAAAWLDPMAFGLSFRLIGGDCASVASVAQVPCAMATQILPNSAIGLLVGIMLGGISAGGAIMACLMPDMRTQPSAMRGRERRLFVPGIAILVIVPLAVLFIAGVQSAVLLCAVMALSVLIGMALVHATGPAPVPTMLPMLYGASGWAAAALGFALHNGGMVVVGGLAGSAGATLCVRLFRARGRSSMPRVAGIDGPGSERG